MKFKPEIKKHTEKKLPNGYVKNKYGVIPSDWEMNELGNYIIDIKSGLSRKLSDSDIGIPVIRSNNIIKNRVDFLDIKYWYLKDPQGANTENYFLKDGDILVNFINSLSQIGKAAMFINRISRKAIFTTNILKMTLNNKLNSKYFLYFTETEKYNRYISLITKPAVNQASFTTVEFKKMKLVVPPLPEQQKIAEILSTWDKAIELKEELIREKKKQKTGLMQNLLNGKVRLPGFDGEWRVDSLKNYFKRVTRRNKNSSSNVLTISAQKGLISQNEYFNKLVASSKLENYYLLKKGEFAYNKSYSNGFPMGAIKRLNEYDCGVVTTLYICFAIKSDQEINSDYFEHYFEFGMLNPGLVQIAHEGGRAHGLLNVTPSDFFDLNINIPPIKEQNAITNLLNKISKNIFLLEKELEALKLQKKGLMQLLLTGIVRVNIQEN